MQNIYRLCSLHLLPEVQFSHLVGGGHRINLFEDSEEIINLYRAIDKMRLGKHFPREG